VRVVFAVLFAVALIAPTAQAQTAADSAAIRAAALDYIDGYWEGNGERMERALHPELAKRIVRTTPTGRSVIEQMSAATLIGYTRLGGGRNTPADRQRKDVRILDIFEGAATARVDAADWVDYLQLARWSGQWRIVNVLWELRPQQAAPAPGR